VTRRMHRNTTTGAGMVRAAGLLGFRRLVEELSGDADALLRAAGIGPRVLESPESLLPYAAMIRLLEDAAVRLDCPNFGLRLAAYQDVRILGPAAMIGLYSDTVGESLKAIGTYFYAHATGGAVGLAGAGATSCDVTFEILIPGLHAKRQINELSVSIGQALLEMLIAPGFRSDRVQFTHRHPSDVTPLKKRFGPHLEFDAPVNAIAIPRDVLSRPVATSNAVFRQVAVQYVHEHVSTAAHDRARHVELLAHQLLPTGRCTLRVVSEVLALHPRSLQRELQVLGTDFRSILDKVRRGLVTGYLRDTDASLGRVAAMLGYGDQAAFTNAFNRWFGMPPRAWRMRESRR
jgi:AraC-like DNA-binding protein